VRTRKEKTGARGATRPGGRATDGTVAAGPSRTVVDTHVLVASFFGGEPRLLMRMWWEGKVMLCVTEEIVAEYVAVLAHLGEAKEEARTLVTALQDSKKAVAITTGECLEVVKDDAAANRFLECAVAAQAEAIIAGDPQLLGLGGFRRIPIMTAGEWLERRRGGSPQSR
jgi:putative PIN family toxin of toxin-antitoxin system